MNLLLTITDVPLTQANTIVSAKVSSIQSLTQGSSLFNGALDRMKEHHPNHTVFNVWDYSKNLIATVSLHDTPVAIPPLHFLYATKSGYVEVQLHSKEG